MAASLKVSVVSPERIVWEGDAEQVVAPAWDGAMGILRGHAPMLVLLGSGSLRIRSSAGEQVFRVEGGFLQIVDDVVTVLSERAGV